MGPDSKKEEDMERNWLEGIATGSWKFDHIGVVVRDLDQAIQYYRSLGFGDFSANPSEVATDRKVYGKPANIKLKGAETPLGAIRFEMLQPVEGESVQKEFLVKRGEGINHIGFVVEDLDQEVAKLEARGFPVVSSGKIPPHGAFTYVDTSRVGGVFIELIKKP
jgi:methylmalonyl-CoA/ethylmalonyl-CoA epimerase